MTGADPALAAVAHPVDEQQPHGARRGGAIQISGGVVGRATDSCSLDTSSLGGPEVLAAPSAVAFASTFAPGSIPGRALPSHPIL